MKYSRSYTTTVELDHADFEVHFCIEGEPDTFDVQGWEDIEIIEVVPKPTDDELTEIFNYLDKAKWQFK